MQVTTRSCLAPCRSTTTWQTPLPHEAPHPAGARGALGGPPGTRPVAAAHRQRPEQPRCCSLSTHMFSLYLAAYEDAHTHTSGSVLTGRFFTKRSTPNTPNGSALGLPSPRCWKRSGVRCTETGRAGWCLTGRCTTVLKDAFVEHAACRLPISFDPKDNPLRPPRLCTGSGGPGVRGS